MNVAERALRRFDSVQQRHTAPAFVFAIVKKFGDDNGGTLAALMTYYGFLSIFPLLLVLVTVLGRVLRGNTSLQHQIVSSSLKNFPIIGQQLHDNVHALSGSAPGLAVGLLLLTWGGWASLMRRSMRWRRYGTYRGVTAPPSCLESDEQFSR